MTWPHLRVVLALALPICAATGQQVQVVQECFAELTVVGSAPVRQSIAAATVFGPHSSFQLRVDNPAGVSYGGIGMGLDLQPNHLHVSTSGSASFPPMPVSGETRGELLATLPPGRGLLHMVGYAGPSGGPGTGFATITVDVGADGTIEMTAYPWTYTWRGEVSVFVDSATPVPVRIVVTGTLLSVVFDDFFTSVDLLFLPDSCPDAAYGFMCWPMVSEQGPGYIDYTIGTQLSFLVFGFQQVDLPIPGTSCRQLVSLDVVAGIFAGTWRQTLIPLPPGFQLYAQAARFDGGGISTSNGISLICPP